MRISCRVIWIFRLDEFWGIAWQVPDIPCILQRRAVDRPKKTRKQENDYPRPTLRWVLYINTQTVGYVKLYSSHQLIPRSQVTHPKRSIKMCQRIKLIYHDASAVDDMTCEDCSTGNSPAYLPWDWSIFHYSTARRICMYHARNIVYAYLGIRSYNLNKIRTSCQMSCLAEQIDVSEHVPRHQWISCVPPPNMLYTSKSIYIKLGTMSRQWISLFSPASFIWLIRKHTAYLFLAILTWTPVVHII